MQNDFLAVGTEEGAYLLSSNSRENWKSSGLVLRGESVNSFAFDYGHHRLYAATLGEGVFISDNLGKTWTPSSRGLHVRKVWAVEVDPKESSRIYAGTHYGHLFKSEDSGKTWAEVSGLHNAPNRKEWGVDWAGGTTGLAVHTVRADPRSPDRLYIVSSGAGPYRSDDRGETWKLIQDGVLDACPVGGRSGSPDIPKGERAKRLKEHLKLVHTCTHKLAVSKKRPDVLYQQNHCGVFRSTDAGETWTDISPADRVRHGFPISLVEDDADSVFVVPAYQGICKKHNSCVRGQVAVYRRRESAWSRLSGGLPRNAHTCVLRDAMTTDSASPAGLYFGTTTGEVFGSIDAGESWTRLVSGMGRIQGLASFST